MFSTLLQVALGGALGASARYLAVLGAARLLTGGFPFGTLSVNVLGSALMGICVVVLAERWNMQGAPFLLAGVLGGFTTFSAFSLDALALYERGAVGQAGLYVGGSVLLSIGALVLAVWVTRGVLQ